MQLDSATIVIRERSLAEIFDLALHVIRAHLGPLVLLTLICATPFTLLNIWLVNQPIPDIQWEEDQYGWLFLNFLLIVLESPIVLAPLTIYLGQVTFQPRADYRRVLGDFLGSLPQMLMVQVFWRGLTLTILHLARPYASEVILLERNRLAGGRGGAMTTRRRVIALHRGWFGELLGRWLAACGVAAVVAVALSFTIYSTLGLFAGHPLSSENAVQYIFPAAIWITAAYLTVARFLAYLDLRIRREGWEIELDMRAEALRLTRQPA